MQQCFMSLLLNHAHDSVCAHVRDIAITIQLSQDTVKSAATNRCIRACQLTKAHTLGITVYSRFQVTP